MNFSLYYESKLLEHVNVDSILESILLDLTEDGVAIKQLKDIIVKHIIIPLKRFGEKAEQKIISGAVPKIKAWAMEQYSDTHKTTDSKVTKEKVEKVLNDPKTFVKDVFKGTVDAIRRSSNNDDVWTDVSKFAKITVGT